MLYFNPLDKFCKNSIGGATTDTKLIFRVVSDANCLFFAIHKDGESTETRYAMTKINHYFQVELFLGKGLYFYHFDFGNGKMVGLSDDYMGEIQDNPHEFQLTIYDKHYKVPSWLNGGIIYQIFPDRFCRSGETKIERKDIVVHENWNDTPIYKPNSKGQVMNNDFFGGDLKGIASKLDYLSELGVTAIYLNPIFKAFSNHRYDTGNYLEIDPTLGTEEDLKNLIEKSNEYGIKIILDGVFNHTGDDSIYFNKYGNYDSVGAYQSDDSKYIDWFKFIKYPNIYESWWGITTLPATDKSSSEFIKYITGEDGVIEHYTKLGIGGWRLDVVDELPAHFVREIRNAVKRNNQDAIIIGEVWEDASNKIAYSVRREYFQGRELDSVMNYPLKNAIIDYVLNGNVKHLSYTIKEQIDHYPTQVLNTLMNLLATHDTYRLMSAVGELYASNKPKEEQDKLVLTGELLDRATFRVKIATLLSYTLCGVPSVYYGDEIGMQGYADPLNRKTFKWDNINHNLLNFFIKLGEIRRSYSCFANGEFEELYSKFGAYMFKRYNEESEVLIMTNVGEEVKINFEGQLKNLLDGKIYEGEYLSKKNTFAVFVKNN